ncbi:MAG: type II secretion system F family protein [[Clostridium] cellulosi]
MKFILPFSSAVLVFCIVVMLLSHTGKRTIRLNKRLESVKELGQKPKDELDAMNLPFNERFLKPMLTRLLGYIGSVLPMSKKSLKRLTDQLSQAGIRMSARNYAAMNVLIILGLTIICGYIGILLKKPPLIVALFALGGFYAGYALRRFSLTSIITKRKNALQSQMPEVLDLLSVSVSAGLGFDQALAYVVSKSEGPLIDELYVAQQEIALGRPRKDALKRFAERCNIEEIRLFVSAVVQADELGISMQNVLTAQAQMIRTAHKQRVEEAAMKIPIKLLIPLVLFIFPVIFIILLGPAIPTILQTLGGL